MGSIRPIHSVIILTILLVLTGGIAWLVVNWQTFGQGDANQLKTAIVEQQSAIPAALPTLTPTVTLAPTFMRVPTLTPVPLARVTSFMATNAKPTRDVPRLEVRSFPDKPLLWLNLNPDVVQSEGCENGNVLFRAFIFVRDDDSNSVGIISGIITLTPTGITPTAVLIKDGYGEVCVPPGRYTIQVEGLLQGSNSALQIPFSKPAEESTNWTITLKSGITDWTWNLVWSENRPVEPNEFP